MEELLKQLYDETTVEDLQKKTGKNINTHSFIEINYVLNGQCTQRLNGEKFLLKKDQLVILDRKVIQQIDHVDSEDILINILLDKESIQNEIIPNLPASRNLVTDFFFQAANAENEHNNYILLDASKSELSKKLFFALLLAGYNRTNGDKRLLINLLYCALMVEISSIPIISTNKKLTINDPLIQILKYINDHYTTITLKSLGKKFGYNKNYLSNLLKDKTGSSFQELIDQKRVSEAKRLMSETEDSLSTIAMKIGYKSVPSIFKLFKKETGQTPNFFRNEHSN